VLIGGVPGCRLDSCSGQPILNLYVLWRKVAAVDVISFASVTAATAPVCSSVFPAGPGCSPASVCRRSDCFCWCCRCYHILLFYGACRASNPMPVAGHLQC
jgi:hypothetical protein